MIDIAIRVGLVYVFRSLEYIVGIQRQDLLVFGLVWKRHHASFALLQHCVVLQKFLFCHHA